MKTPAPARTPDQIYTRSTRVCISGNRILKNHAVVPASNLDEIKQQISANRDTVERIELANKKLEEDLADPVVIRPPPSDDVRNNDTSSTATFRMGC